MVKYHFAEEANTVWQTASPPAPYWLGLELAAIDLNVPKDFASSWEGLPHDLAWYRLWGRPKR